MLTSVEIENRAGLGRVTCGWKLPTLSLEAVRPYWRDAHSPAIARRDGIYEYRHYPLDAVRDLFGPLDRIETEGDPAASLMWLSDVRYLDQAGLDAFGASPGAMVEAQDSGGHRDDRGQEHDYLVVGENGRTLLDRTGDPAPAGPVSSPTFQIFFRRRGGEAGFRNVLLRLSERWSGAPGVRRLRLSLFETPDMERSARPATR